MITRAHHHVAGLALLVSVCILPLAAQSSVSVGFAGATGVQGFLFKVDAANPVVIRGFDVSLGAGVWDLEVYAKNTPGGWVGFENDPTAWTRIAGYPARESQGAGTPFSLPFDLARFVNGGQTQSFCIATKGPGALGTTQGIGAGVPLASDANLTVFSGIGTLGPFGVTVPQRAWNGTVHYYTAGRTVPSPSHPTVQSAIAAATSGEAIRVAAGTYFENIDFMGKDVLVYGAAGAGLTTLDAGGSGSVVSFQSGETRGAGLHGLTITGGLGPVGRAGGIWCPNGSPTISHCRITANTGGSGGLGGAPGAGGVDTGNNSFLGLFACRVDGNQGGNAVGLGFGAAGGVGLRGPLELLHCEIDHNVGGNRALGNGGAGGVSYGFAPSVTDVTRLTACHLHDNQGGGGLRGGAGGLHANSLMQTFVRRGSIHDNQGGNGTSEPGGAGGVDVGEGIVVVISSLLYGNSGGSSSSGLGGAGGIQVEGNSLLEVLHATLTDNTGGSGVAPGPGGVAFRELLNPGSLAVNSIIWGNAGLSVDETLHPTQPHPASMISCDLQGGWGGASTNVFDADPAFVNPSGGDFRLQVASPCIDGGTDTSSYYDLFRDFEGDLRDLLAAPDVGADEVTDPYLPGTREDLALSVRVNGASSFFMGQGSQVAVTISSPGWTFAAAPPILLGQVYANGSPPVGLGAFGVPEIHVDLGSPILFDGTPPGPIGPIVIGTQGLTLNFSVPLSLPGTTLRLQGLAISPASRNGVFAVSGAQDVAFQ